MKDNVSIRKNVIARRNAIPFDVREMRSHAIAKLVISEIANRVKDGYLFCYLSAGSEVGTDEIIDYAMDKVKLCVPKVAGHKMTAVAVDRKTEFVVGKYGIKEPKDGEIVRGDNIDLIITPLVGYDGCNRLGHGCGFYDGFESTGYRLGLAFSEQRCEFASNDHDVVMDNILTEKGYVK